MAERLTHLQFSVHGIDLRLTTNSPAIAESVSDLLQLFRCQHGDLAGVLRLRFDAVRKREQVPVHRSGSAKVLYNGAGLITGDQRQVTWACEIVADGRLLVADFGKEGVIVIDGDALTAQGYLVEPETMHSEIRVSFFHFAMMELLKRRDLYTFHATALERQGLGILIPGYSGTGKTTAFLSLLRSGYRYLSDDHPFLRVDRGHVELLPFPMRINVTDTTLSFFPELRRAGPRLIHQAKPKSSFHCEDLYPGPLGTACEPAVILFPHVIDAPGSCLELLSKSAALNEILPHCLLVFDPYVARREFEALVTLVRRADCYRLHFGRDVLDLPRLVDPLLEARLTGAQH